MPLGLCDTLYITHADHAKPIFALPLDPDGKRGKSARNDGPVRW